LIHFSPNSFSTIALLTAAIVAPDVQSRGSVFAAEASPAIVVVDLNQSRLLNLPKAPHRVIVSDPALLGVSVSPDGVILTGLERGETTMDILDDSDAVVMKTTVRVEAHTETDITVQHGLERRTYHCAPHCSLLGIANDQGGAAPSAGTNTTAAAPAPTDPSQPKPTGGKGL
jgi:Pilus formation protein N terminal region